MEKFRFLLSGAGGQGIISMGVILAEAAVLHDGLNAVQTQSYGPEARGGATRSDVIISDAPIYFPTVLQPNVLLALTNEAATKYLPLARPGALMLYDSELVRPDLHTDARLKGLPMLRATQEALGSAIAYNITVDYLQRNLNVNDQWIEMNFRMRSAGDFRTGEVLKQQWLNDFLACTGDEFAYAFDDDPKMVNFYRRNNIPLFLV